MGPVTISVSVLQKLQMRRKGSILAAYVPPALAGNLSGDRAWT